MTVHLLTAAIIAEAIALVILAARLSNVEEDVKRVTTTATNNADHIRTLRERAGQWPSAPPRAVRTLQRDPYIWSNDA